MTLRRAPIALSGSSQPSKIGRTSSLVLQIPAVDRAGAVVDVEVDVELARARRALRVAGQMLGDPRLRSEQPLLFAAHRRHANRPPRPARQPPSGSASPRSPSSRRRRCRWRRRRCATSRGARRSSRLRRARAGSVPGQLRDDRCRHCRLVVVEPSSRTLTRSLTGMFCFSMPRDHVVVLARLSVTDGTAPGPPSRPVTKTVPCSPALGLTITAAPASFAPTLCACRCGVARLCAASATDCRRWSRKRPTSARSRDRSAAGRSLRTKFASTGWVMTTAP